MFKVMFRMKQPQRTHKTIRKQLCPSNKSLKLNVLKWIAISSKEGRI